MQREIYDVNEFKKQIIEETVDGTETTTYIGIIDREDYLSSADTATEKWQIKKIVEDSSTGITEFFRPTVDGVIELGFKFARDDKETLTYI